MASDSKRAWPGVGLGAKLEIELTPHPPQARGSTRLPHRDENLSGDEKPLGGLQRRRCQELRKVMHGVGRRRARGRIGDGYIAVNGGGCIAVISAGLGARPSHRRPELIARPATRQGRWQANGLHFAAQPSRWPRRCSPATCPTTTTTLVACWPGTTCCGPAQPSARSCDDRPLITVTTALAVACRHSRRDDLLSTRLRAAPRTASQARRLGCSAQPTVPCSWPCRALWTSRSQQRPACGPVRRWPRVTSRRRCQNLMTTTMSAPGSYGAQCLMALPPTKGRPRR